MTTSSPTTRTSGRFARPFSIMPLHTRGGQRQAHFGRVAPNLKSGRGLRTAKRDHHSVESPCRYPIRPLIIVLGESRKKRSLSEPTL